MVDSVTGNAPIKAVEAVRRAQQNAQQEQSVEVSTSGDSVEISSEAADLATAGQAAQQVRVALEGNTGITLGLDAGFDVGI